MPDNLESIGGVSVSIRGDYSDLPADFEAAVKIAVDAGHTLAEAIALATKAPDTTAAQDAIGGIGAAALAAGQQLGLFATAVEGVPFSEATGQLNMFTDELEQFKGASQTASQAAALLEQNLAHVGEASGQAGVSFHHFAESVGEFIEHPLQSAGEGVTKFIESIGPLGVGLAAVASTALIAGHAIFELVAEEGKAAEATQNMAYRLNLGFEETKKLGEMAQVAGINIDILQRVSMRLADAMENADTSGKKVATALDKLGVAANDSGELLLQTLEKLAEIPDATERISKAHEIMGRGAVQLEPLLANYRSLREAVEQLGGALDEDMVKRLTEADDALDLLTISWAHFKEGLAATFAPAVIAGLQALTALISSPPPDNLSKQIEALTADLEAMKKEAEDAKGAVAGVFAASTGMVGPDVTATMVAAKEAQLELLKGQKEAIERSKEYNEEIARSNREQQKLAAEQKAAYQEMEKAAIGFHNAVVGLYNTFPETYAEYADKLEQGGKKATSTLETLSAEIDKAKSLSESLRGKPLQDVKDWIDALEQMRLKAKEFADTDAFLKAASKIAELTAKFPEQTNQLREMGVGFIEFFDRMETVAANKPVSKGWEADIELIKKDLETRKQLDDQTQKWERTSTRAYDAMAEAGRKAAGIPSDIKKALDDLEPDSEKLWAGFDQGTQEAFASAMELRAALKALGYDAAEGQGKVMALFDKVAKDGRSSLQEVEFAWSKVSGQVQNLAKTNLPAAIEKFDEYIQRLVDGGAALGYIYQLEEQRLSLEIRDAEQRGKDATEQIIQLEKIKIAHEQLIDASSLLGDMWVSLYKDFDRAWGTMAHGIADNIVNLKDWGDVFMGILDKIEKEILNTLIGTVFKALEDSLEKQTGLMQKLADGATAAMGKLTGVLGLGKKGGGIPGGIPGSGEVGAEGSGLPTGGAPDLSGEAEGIGGGAAPSKGSSGGSGGMGGAMGWLSLGVDVAKGVVTGIQLAHIESDVAKIEISTRQCKEQLLHIQDTFNTYLPELKHLTDIWGELANGTLARIRDVLTWGVVNVNIAGTGGVPGTSGAAGPGQDPRSLGWAKGEQDKRNEEAQQDQTVATETLTTATELATNSMRNIHETALRSTVALQRNVEAVTASTEAVRTNSAPTFSGIDAGVARMTQQDALDYFAKQLRSGGTFLNSGDGGLASLASQAGMSLEAAKAMVAEMQPKWDAMLAGNKEHLRAIAESTKLIAKQQKEMDERSAHPIIDPASTWAIQTKAAQEALVLSTRSLEATIAAWQSQFLGESMGRDPKATAAASAELTARINAAIAQAGLGGVAKVQGLAGSFGGTGEFTSGTILQRPEFSFASAPSGSSPTTPSAPGPIAMVTVNALNPSSRGVTQALVDGLQQAGLRTR